MIIMLTRFTEEFKHFSSFFRCLTVIWFAEIRSHSRNDGKINKSESIICKIYNLHFTFHTKYSKIINYIQICYLQIDVDADRLHTDRLLADIQSIWLQ